MKKGSVIVFTIMVLELIFLFLLWLYFGLNRIDEPMILAVNLVWWGLIIAAGILLYRAERARERDIRSFFISEDIVFNTEVGSFPYNDLLELVVTMERIIKNLRYGFKKQKFPNDNAYPIAIIVHTDAFKKGIWSGEVVSPGAEMRTSFTNKEGLIKILKGLLVFSTVDIPLSEEKPHPRPEDEPTS